MRPLAGDRRAGLGPASSGERSDCAHGKRSDFAVGMDVLLVSDNVDLVINAGFEAE